MLSKTQSKYIRSLAQQKYREEHKVFVAEGVKLAAEWLQSSWSIQFVLALPGWAAANAALLAKHPEATVIIVEPHQLEQHSLLQTANEVLLVVHQPNAAKLPGTMADNWIIALDNVQDPGNVGTIIRIADWFGLPAVVCGSGTADCWNPKVVQAGMGGHLRVSIIAQPLLPWLNRLGMPIFAAALDGENVFGLERPGGGVLIIGNESKGISDEVLATATLRVKIPRKGGAESLNAAVSAGILCAWLAGQ